MDLRVTRPLILFLPLLPLAAAAQTLVPTVIAPMATALNETSGLVVLDGQVWTQLDSGNPNALYRIDPANGEVLRMVTVTNATNVDGLYIGDRGNNNGSRTNLRAGDTVVEIGSLASGAYTLRTGSSVWRILVQH